MAQQTAVEWLWRWINDNQKATIKQGNEAFEQAKAMDKEQKMNTFADGFVEGIKTQKSGEQLLFPEQYYNENYKK
jgi:hypothetical protein